MKCFYHNDMDGRCAASIVAQYELTKGNQPNKSDYIEVDYTKPLPDVVSKNETVYIVDYSFTEPTLNQLQNILSKTYNVTWCDHHTSTFKLIENHPELNGINGIREDNVSGAMLVYRYLIKGNTLGIPEYIKLVSDYDCWQFKYGERTTYFKLGIDAVDFDALDYVWKVLFADANVYVSSLNQIIDNGKAIKQYVDKSNAFYLNDYGYESEVCGHKCLVVNKKTNSWIFGDKFKEYPVCIVYVFNGEQYVYSIYSNDPTIDCSKIAEKYLGGGHSGAAGFTSKELLFKKNI